MQVPLALLLLSLTFAAHGLESPALAPDSQAAVEQSAEYGILVGFHVKSIIMSNSETFGRCETNG
jgi:hypothetical protein